MDLYLLTLGAYKTKVATAEVYRRVRKEFPELVAE